MATATKRPTKRIIPPEAHAEYVGRGVWVITTNVMPPSQNVLDREHWTKRRNRKDLLTELFWAAHIGKPTVYVHPIARLVTFERARIVPLLFFRDKRVRDYANFMGGLKQHVDGLVSSGWLLADDTKHLLHERPVMDVDRANPRCVLRLEPWGGDS